MWRCCMSEVILMETWEPGRTEGSLALTIQSWCFMAVFLAYFNVFQCISQGDKKPALAIFQGWIVFDYIGV